MTAGFAALPDPELPDFVGVAAFSAGFASSSAMMRRIDARISSIEGSWTFAGCVISDSTSSTPSPAFYTNRDGIDGSGFVGPDFRPLKPDLSPDQVPPATFARSRPHARAVKRRVIPKPNTARIAL